jgi:TRAP-type transport system periplasmic protein
MRKYVLLVGLSLLLILSLLAISCKSTTSSSPSTSQPPQTVTLRLAHDSTPAAPGGGPYHLKEAADEVTARTNGRVKFEFYWMESLVKKTEFLGAAGSGTCDITEITPATEPDKIPLIGVTATVPFEPASVDKSQQALLKIMQVPEIISEWDKNNVKVIGADLRPPKSIFSTIPLRTLADINGVKIRESNETNMKIWGAAGGVASYIAMPEIYESIQRGVIQGLGADLGIVIELKFYEVCKYFHENLGFGAFVGFIVMNKDSLNKLSSDDQQVVLDSFGKMASRQIDVLKANNAKYLEQSGLEVIHFSDADLAKWRELPQVKAIVTDWVKQKNDKGLAGTKVMNAWLEALGLNPL